MIQEFIKEYRALRKTYNNMAYTDDHQDDMWMSNAMEELVCRYETELNIQSLKEMQSKEGPNIIEN